MTFWDKVVLHAKWRISGITKPIQLRRYSRFQTELSSKLTFSEAAATYHDRNALYAFMHHYLLHLAPEEIREHRKYYSQNNRGFGEDAFHAMWWTLLAEYKPGVALEIGVYRGQVTS